MITKKIKKLCKEYWLIENYEEAINDDKMWDCHHRIEVSEDGLHTVYSKEELKKCRMYLNRKPEELIFLTRSDHWKLHNNTIEVIENKRRRMTSEIKEKLSQGKKEYWNNIKSEESAKSVELW